MHDPGHGHPERADRLRAIHAKLAASGMLGELEALEPRKATEAELARVHAPEHVARVRAACARAPARLDADTAVSEGSWRRGSQLRARVCSCTAAPTRGGAIRSPGFGGRRRDRTSSSIAPTDVTR